MGNPYSNFWVRVKKRRKLNEREGEEEIEKEIIFFYILIDPYCA
jgi:hypothetical protein